MMIVRANGSAGQSTASGSVVGSIDPTEWQVDLLVDLSAGATTATVLN